jgi:hypothetical protein
VGAADFAFLDDFFDFPLMTPFFDLDPLLLLWLLSLPLPLLLPLPFVGTNPSFAFFAFFAFFDADGELLVDGARVGRILGEFVGPLVGAIVGGPLDGDIVGSGWTVGASDLLFFDFPVFVCFDPGDIDLLLPFPSHLCVAFWWEYRKCSPVASKTKRRRQMRSALRPRGVLMLQYTNLRSLETDSEALQLNDGTSVAFVDRYNWSAVVDRDYLWFADCSHAFGPQEIGVHRWMDVYFENNLDNAKKLIQRIEVFGRRRRAAAY